MFQLEHTHTQGTNPGRKRRSKKRTHTRLDGRKESRSNLTFCFSLFETVSVSSFLIRLPLYLSGHRSSSLSSLSPSIAIIIRNNFLLPLPSPILSFLICTQWSRKQVSSHEVVITSGREGEEHHDEIDRPLQFIHLFLRPFFLFSTLSLSNIVSQQKYSFRFLPFFLLKH